MQIINILPHLPHESLFSFEHPEEYKARFSDTHYIKVNEKSKWVGFSERDWHHKWGCKILELDTSIQMECWRPYGPSISNVYSKEIGEIWHRVFPSTEKKVRRYGNIERSPLLLEWILQYHEKLKGKVVFHFYGYHTNLSTWLLESLRGKGINIIVQQLGGWFPIFEVNKSPLNILKLWKHRKELRALREVNTYLTCSRTEEEYLKKVAPNLDIKLFFNGCDVDQLKQVGQSFARASLNLPLKAEVVLYVGKFYSTKNVDILIDAYNSLKVERPNLILVLVGGYKTDEFYEKAVASGAKVVLRSDSSINNYFEAADIYVMPIKDPLVKEFGGIGVAPLESLFLGTPVVSENLKHFKGPLSELKYLGEQRPDWTDISKTLTNILDRKMEFKYCRELVLKYYDIQLNSSKIINLYQELLNQDL